MRRPRSAPVIFIAGAVLLIAAVWFRLRVSEPPVERAALAYKGDPVPPLKHAEPVLSSPPALESPPTPEPVPLPAKDEPDPFGPPRIHPRPAQEWQGMLMDLNISPPCEAPAGCGMARACKAGRCSPCEADSDCAPGEGCVLDHCVKSANIGCHRRADCAEGSSCVLSGYSSGPRGNEDMRAFCLKLASGADRLPPRQTPVGKDQRDHLPDDDLLKAARDARRQ